MKTKMFFILTLATAIFTTSLTANSLADGFTSVKVSSVNKFLNVKVTKSTEEDVVVKIETTEGLVLQTDQIEKNKTGKRYDLRQLPMGDYRLVVFKNKAKMVQPFTINFDAISIAENERTFIMLPSVKVTGDKMDVKVFASEEESITLRIIDNLGVQLFEEMTEAKTLSKRYDLSKLPKGVYFVEVNSEYFTIKL